MLGPHLTAERLAYDYLRQRIVSGAVKGGTPILQQQVADHLGISRIPVRDAIKHLSAEGLVTIESNRRVVVTEMTIADVKEIFLIMSVVEGLAARNAAPRMSDEVLERLSVLAERMERAETDVDEWLRVHEQFHRLICSQSGMARLQREAERQRGAAEPYLRVFFAKHGVKELKDCKHRPLLTALRKRDAELAESIVRKHIEKGFDEISRVIDESAAAETGGGRDEPVDPKEAATDVKRRPPAVTTS